MIPNPEQTLQSISSIHSQKLILRRFRESDTPSVLTYGSDTETVKHLIWPGVQTLAEAHSAVRNILIPHAGVFAITLTANDDTCIGCIDMRLETTHEKAGFGYVLNRAHWGKGIMSTALNLLFKIGFDVLELRRMESHHFQDNIASGRVMLKCGMTREGVARKEYKIKGAFVDVVHYGILREDWSQLAGRKQT